MAISLASLKKTSAVRPPRLVIYGPEGMGKTTLASEFPNAVFLQIEDGTPSDLTLDTFGELESYEDVANAIDALVGEDHGFQTVVVDAIDKLEALIYAETCKRNNWQTIEAPGYGKGYKEADYVWREFMSGMNALRARGMAVVLLAHSDIDRFDDPQAASYSRYDLRIHERGAAIIKDEVDAILLIKQEAAIKEHDEGFNRKRAQADGGGARWIYSEARPAFVAKNRYGMPARFMYVKGKGFNEMAKFFPGMVEAQPEPEKPVADPAPEGDKAEDATKPKGRKKADATA